MDLAELIDVMVPRLRGVQRLAVSGAQGAGKSTLCAALADRLSAQEKRVVTISLDDVYLSKAQRQHLADTVHPLCAVRGVPGTHDIALLNETLESLQAGQGATPLPQFSKAQDDVVPRSDWPVFEGKPDLIILEGWCVGAMASDLVLGAQNGLEQQADPQSVWKDWSRSCAAGYEPLWQSFDFSVLIAPPDFDAVIDARWAQEQKMFTETGKRQFENRDAVAWFCAHYESWTRGLWQHLPARADIVVDRTRSFDFTIRQTS